MTSIRELLAPVKERADAATQGPWRTWKEGEDRRGSAVETAWAHDTDGEDTDLITDWCSPEDAAFIAQARTDVPRLVAAIEAVEAKLAEWWDKAGPGSGAERVFGRQVVSVEFAVTELRAAVVAALESEA